MLILYNIDLPSYTSYSIFYSQNYILTLNDSIHCFCFVFCLTMLILGCVSVSTCVFKLSWSVLGKDYLQYLQNFTQKSDSDSLYEVLFLVLVIWSHTLWLASTGAGVAQLVEFDRKARMQFDLLMQVSSPCCSKVVVFSLPEWTSSADSRVCRASMCTLML